MQMLASLTTCGKLYVPCDLGPERILWNVLGSYMPAGTPALFQIAAVISSKHTLILTVVALLYFGAHASTWSGILKYLLCRWQHPIRHKRCMRSSGSGSPTKCPPMSHQQSGSSMVSGSPYPNGLLDTTSNSSEPDQFSGL